MAEPATSGSNNFETRDDIRNKIDEIDSVVNKLGYQVFNGKIEPQEEFPPVSWIALAVAFAFYISSKMFETNLLLAISFYSAAHGLRGVIGRTIFDLKTNS